MKKNKNKAFWISNVSKRNVCLADLALTIPKGRSMNLLDSRHFHYTEDQLIKSKESGSLFKKQRLVKVRQVEPDPPIVPGKYVSKEPLFMRQIRENSPVEEEYFEELDVSEEDFIDDITEGMKEIGVVGNVFQDPSELIFDPDE